MKNKGKIPSPVGLQQNPVSGSTGASPADDPSVMEMEIRDRKSGKTQKESGEAPKKR